MYLVSQRSTGAPLDRQHTTQEMALHTKFIGDIFEYCELVIKLIVFRELQHSLLPQSFKDSMVWHLRYRHPN